MRIYFDSCALNRLTDAPSQLRIRLEAEAVEKIFRMVWKGRMKWVASQANEIEIRRNPSEQMRRDGLKLLSFANEQIESNVATRIRTAELARLGYGLFDAFHLACAEQGSVDVLLTTDDRFIGKAERQIGTPGVPLKNPVDWAKRIVP